MRALVLAAVILCTSLCTSIAQAEEIKLPEVPQYELTAVVADLPYDFAKHMPPELYYWWAKAHNQRTYDRADAYNERNRSSTLRTTTRGTLSTPGLSTEYSEISPGRTSYENNVFIRNFREQIGRGPVTIYNPYYRRD